MLDLINANPNGSPRPGTPGRGETAGSAGAAENRRARLTPRAHTILCWIGQGGLAHADQLGRGFWPLPYKAQSVYKYLHTLVQDGYLLTRPYRFLDIPRTLYALTPLAAVALNIQPPFVRVGWPPPQEYPHLLLGQEVRLHLERRYAELEPDGRILAWRTDYLLRYLQPPAQAQTEIADIEVEWQPGPGEPIERFQIEIDGAYFGTMLATKAAAYGSQSCPVIWACLPGRAARVAAATAAYPNIQILVLHPTTSPSEVLPCR